MYKATHFKFVLVPAATVKNWKRSKSSSPLFKKIEFEWKYSTKTVTMIIE